MNSTGSPRVVHLMLLRPVRCHTARGPGTDRSYSFIPLRSFSLAAREMFFRKRHLKNGASKLIWFSSKSERNHIIWVPILVVLTVAFGGPTRAQEQLPLPPSECVDVNIAEERELRQIVHIGDARAAEIVRLRQLRPFRSIEDLQRVRGIGPARLRDIKEQGLACVTVRNKGVS